MSAIQDDLWSCSPPSRPVQETAPPGNWTLTSALAAERIRPARGELHKLILGYLRANGPASDESIAAVLGLNPSTARPRRVELVEAGLIRKDGTGLTKAGRRCQLWSVA